jgi:ATP-dependent Clp protease ATP-binding subunit ClpA
MLLALRELPLTQPEKEPRYNSVFAREVRKQILEQERDCVLVVTGKQGIGKTTAALSLAQAIFPELINENNFESMYVFASAEDFSNNLAASFPKGSPLISDEMAITARKGDFQKAFAKKLNDLLNIKRTQYRLIIFILPLLPDTLKDVRTKIDYLIEVREKNTKINEFEALVSAVDINTFDGKLHRVRPRWRTMDGVKWENGFAKTPIMILPKLTIFTKLIIKGITKSCRDKLKHINITKRTDMIQSTTRDIVDELHSDEKVDKAIDEITNNPTAYQTSRRAGSAATKWDRAEIARVHKLGSHRLQQVVGRLTTHHKDLLNPG